MSKYAAIIMAAGKGTRMKSDLPKVLHEILGRPMLAYVLDACREAGVTHLCGVVGHKAEMVKEAFAGADDIAWVIQAEQRGTGHAVMCCEKALKDFQGHTIVLCGDAPLIRTQTLKTLLATHEKEQSAITLATAIFDDPTGYGRIVRDANGNIEAIVEQNDCTAEQAAIQEVNPSYYCFDNQVLFELLPHITANNAKNEYYLTDIVSVAIAQGKRVVGVTAVQQEESMGINSKEQLAQVAAMMEERLQQGNLCL